MSRLSTMWCPHCKLRHERPRNRLHRLELNCLARDKVYDIYLFAAPECRRHWLAYSTLNLTTGDWDVHVQVQAFNSSSAKNLALTAANNNWQGVTVVKNRKA